MKKINISIILISSVIIMGLSCEGNNNQEIDCLVKNRCFINESNPVKKITNQEGIIWFNNSQKNYAVYVGVTGSYDSQLVGIVCNLPKEYEVEGLEIIFSGSYYDYDKIVSDLIPGQKYYYLDLCEIKKK